MKLRTERAVFLFTLFLMISAFAAGQLGGEHSQITSYATSEFASPITSQVTNEAAFNFEDATSLEDYLDVVWSSVGEGTMDMIIAFGIVFAIFVIGLGMVGDIAKNDGARRAMMIFAVFASFGTTYYINVNNIPFTAFIGEYSLIITVLLMAMILGRIAMSMKSDKSSYEVPLISGGLAMMLIGLSMIHILDKFDGWGWILLVAGVLFVFFGAFALLVNSGDDDDKKSLLQRLPDLISGKDVGKGLSGKDKKAAKDAQKAFSLISQGSAVNTAAIKAHSVRLDKILADLQALAAQGPAQPDPQAVASLVSEGNKDIITEIALMKKQLLEFKEAYAQQQNIINHTQHQGTRVEAQKTLAETAQIIHGINQILELLKKFSGKLNIMPQAAQSGQLADVLAELRQIHEAITRLEKQDRSISNHIRIEIGDIGQKEVGHAKVDEQVQQHEEQDPNQITEEKKVRFYIKDIVSRVEDLNEMFDAVYRQANRKLRKDGHDGMAVTDRGKLHAKLSDYHKYMMIERAELKRIYSDMQKILALSSGDPKRVSFVEDARKYTVKAYKSFETEVKLYLKRNWKFSPIFRVLRELYEAEWVLEKELKKE